MPHQNRMLDPKCLHDSEHIVSQVIRGVVPVCRCGFAGHAEAPAGNAIDVVPAGELLRKAVKAMGGVSVPRKKDEGPSRPSPIQNLKSDIRFYRDKLHLRSWGEWLCAGTVDQTVSLMGQRCTRWSGERRVKSDHRANLRGPTELTSGYSAQDENTIKKTKASMWVHLASSVKCTSTLVH